MLKNAGGSCYRLLSHKEHTNNVGMLKNTGVPVVKGCCHKKNIPTTWVCPNTSMSKYQFGFGRGIVKTFKV
jgi:hypothetical protein